MRRTAVLAGCLVAVACGSGRKPTDDMCLAAADNIVALFTAEGAGDPAAAGRATKRAHRNFFESCRDTGTIEQAACASQASSVGELERCP